MRFLKFEQKPMSPLFLCGKKGYNMIKNYIFDFGDVFLNLDKPATTQELLKLGMTDFTDEMLSKNKEYEKGLVSTE